MCILLRQNASDIGLQPMLSGSSAAAISSADETEEAFERSENADEESDGATVAISSRSSKYKEARVKTSADEEI